MGWLSSKPVYAILLLVFVLLAISPYRSQLESRYEVEDFFPEDTEIRAQFDSYRSIFGRDDRLAVMLIESDETFAKRDFQRLLALESSVSSLPQVEDVYSPATTQIVLRDENHQLKLSPAFTNRDFALPEDEFAQRVALVLERFSQRPYAGNVFSKDGKIAIFSILLHDDHLDHASRLSLVRSLQQEQRILERQGYHVRLSGYPIHRVFLSQEVSNDSKQVLPWVLGLLAVVLFVVFRSFVAVIAPLLVASVSVWATVCTMSAFGVPTNILSPALFILVILISLSDSIHLISLYRETNDVTKTVRSLMWPCFLTSATTAAVFAGLLLTGIPMIEDMGIGVAIGVLIAYVVAFLLIPPLLRLDRKPTVGTAGVSQILDSLQRNVVRHPRRYLLGIGAFFLLSAVFATNIKINSPLLSDLRQDHFIFETHRLIEQRIGGVIPVDLVIQAQASELYSQEMMEKLSRITDRLAEKEEIVTLSSPIDMLYQLQPFLPDVPDSEITSLLPMALLLAEPQFKNWVNIDADTIRISMRINNLDTPQSIRLFEEIDELVSQELDGNYHLTGQGYIGQKVNQAIVFHYRDSFIVGLFVVGLILLIAFRNVRYLIAIVLANLFPMVAICGVMGLLGIDLRYTSALALTVAFGLVVDDSIHMIAQLHANRGRKDPLGQTVRSAGVGVVWTSVVVGIGFLALLGSRFSPNQVLGLLLALAAVFAIVGDLILLPALLAVYKRNNLVSVLFPVHKLDEETKKQLFCIFQTCYDGTAWEQFHRDLMNKQWILLLRQGGVFDIKGFSTIRVLNHGKGHTKCRLLYSGDTVVLPAFWGQKSLQIGFSKFVMRLRFRTFGVPLYWLLTSKGYKTYLLMTNYFPYCWPRHDVDLPDDKKRLITSIGSTLYAEKFDTKTGVIAAGQDYVKQDVVPLTEQSLGNPHLRYFVSANPNYANGDELLCLALIRRREPFLLLFQSIQKSIFGRAR